MARGLGTGVDLPQIHHYRKRMQVTGSLYPHQVSPPRTRPIEDNVVLSSLFLVLRRSSSLPPLSQFLGESTGRDQGNVPLIGFVVVSSKINKYVADNLFGTFLVPLAPLVSPQLTHEIQFVPPSRILVKMVKASFLACTWLLWLLL